MSLKVVDFKKTNIDQSCIENLEQIINYIKEHPNEITNFILITNSIDSVIRMVNHPASMPISEVVGVLEITKYITLADTKIDNGDE